MKRSLIILIFSLVSLTFAEITVTDIKFGLLQQKNEIHSYQAELINTISGSLVETKTSTGKVYFIAPDLIRTDIYGKAPQSTLTKADKSWNVDYQGKVTEIVQESSLVDSRFSDPVVLFEKFNFSIQSSDQTTTKLIGIPKADLAKELFSTKHFSKIVLYINNSDKTLREIRIHNTQGQEIVKLLTIYQKINNLSFPYSTEILLNIGTNKLQVKTIYQDLKLNPELPLSIFDLDTIKQELRGMPGLKND